MTSGFAGRRPARPTGVVESFSFWGFLRLLPVLLVDHRFRAVRREAEARHLAAPEAPLAERA
ncbi:hypothetical protein ACF065_23355 [Streptomyces sp. NPDC015232]|uniref:hypothetical protein n=1 Tax=unclassified Streptomyces TaxID=2593676 RepID=UPI0036FF81FD